MATLTTNNRAGEVAAPKSWKLWTGRVLTALPVLMLIFSASLKLMHEPGFVEKWTSKAGWPESTLTPIGLLELACVAIHLVPRTAFLGAILLTGYLGGAVASHVRIAEPFVMPLIVGILVWAGYYLRDDRVRALVLPRKS
jgi:DoxX-like family